MTVVTLTDRPKSVRNRCVIEVFGGVFMLSIDFRIFCWYRGFCHRTESENLLFLWKHGLSFLIYTVTGRLIEKGRHLNQSYDKSPYPTEKSKKAT